MARMGNLVVRSTKQMPYADLKKLLVDEVRKQGKPFGLILRDITGGSTNTASYGYQAFKGTPRLSTASTPNRRGDPRAGRGARRHAAHVDHKIVATSDQVGVFNGYCGAESGFVPVSTIAPAVLLTEIELQRAQRTRQRPIVLPPPYSK